MNKTWLFVLAIGLGGCSGGVKYLSPHTQEYISASLDLNDLQNAVQESLHSLYESAFFKQISQPIVLAVSDFINDTTIKLDMEQISSRMIEELQKSGKFLVTRSMSGSGGFVDQMIDQARKARGDEEYDQKSVIAKGGKISAHASLNGKVVQRVTRVGKDQRVDYFFRIEIVEIKTGLVAWSKTIDISKLAQGNSPIW